MIELIVGIIVGFIAGFLIGTLYVVGTVKKNLARFGKDTMENFFKDAVAMSDPAQVIEEPDRDPVKCPSDYIQKHKERK